MNLAIALNAVEKEIESQIASPQIKRPRFSAFETFILALHEWAQAFGFPRSAYKNADAGNFPKLICELLKNLPDEYRNEVPSKDGGVAAHTKRTINAANKIRREQKRNNLVGKNAPLGSK